MGQSIIIVGAGQAGLQVADSLRQDGFDGAVVLLGEESYAPYQRPPLSKKWLHESHQVSSVVLRGAEYLQRRAIDVRAGVRVTALDRTARQVHLHDGTTLSYDGLALCTGARVRRLSVPGADFEGVVGLRGIDDARRIAAAFARCAAISAPVVVIGGGFIGLEAAASACKLGLQVTVVEALDRLMSRVVAPIVSAAALRVHEAHGVRVRCDARVTALHGADGRVTAVELADGTTLPAGCVVFGIGVSPDDGLAAASGLPCDHGILVDACARTADAAIVAAGDCTARMLADGRVLRLESVHNAVEQGRSAAASLLGRERPFIAAPWFWSDQHDLKLQMVGLSAGHDAVVTRGDPAGTAFSAYYFLRGRLIAVDSLNRPQDHMLARKLLDRGLSPSQQQAADPQFNLTSLLTLAAA